MNVMEIDFCSSWLLVNKLTIFFFCLTISHFDIARDVSTATASLLKSSSLDFMIVIGSYFRVQIWLVLTTSGPAKL